MSEQEEALYTTKHTYTLEEFKWINSHYRKSFMSYVQFASMVVGAAIMFIFAKESLEVCAWLYVMGAVIYILLGTVIAPSMIKKNFEALAEADELENEYIFYEDHFIRNYNNGTSNISYSKFKDIVENDKYIAMYLLTGRTLILNKSECPSGLVEFLRGVLDPQMASQFQAMFKKKKLKSVALSLLYIGYALVIAFVF